ncbi:MAG: hypothetical protein WBN40_02485 [Pseudomonadales bacterium]
MIKTTGADGKKRKVGFRKGSAAEPIDIARRQAEMDARQSIDENSSEGIAAQIEAFLSRGKKIKAIPTGVSGITHTGGTKHITISRNKPQNQASR